MQFSVADVLNFALLPYSSVPFLPACGSLDQAHFPAVKTSDLGITHRRERRKTEGKHRRIGEKESPSEPRWGEGDAGQNSRRVGGRFRRSALAGAVNRRVCARLLKCGHDQGHIRTCAGRGSPTERERLSGSWRGLPPDGRAAHVVRCSCLLRSVPQTAMADKPWWIISAFFRSARTFALEWDQGFYGHLTRRNLAVLATERGDHEEARKFWQAVLEECPNDREVLSRLGR